MIAQPPSPLYLITEHPGIAAGIRLYIKRDDLLHPVISGNKWRKLEPVIRLIQERQYAGILSYGGPFSNHLQAVAAAGKMFDFATTGVLRGSSADLNNPTLAAAAAHGMLLIAVSKPDYDRRQLELQQAMQQRFPEYYHLPEGGSTPAARENCRRISAEILEQLPKNTGRKLVVCVPAGTGCTAAGVVDGLGDAGSTWIFPTVNFGLDKSAFPAQRMDAIKGPDFDFINDYTFGGFAVHRPPLIAFVRSFQKQTGILLDPIYTSKMMFGIFDLLEKGAFAANSMVVAVHTGGLQGWAGFRQRFGIDPDIWTGSA